MTERPIGPDVWRLRRAIAAGGRKVPERPVASLGELLPMHYEALPAMLAAHDEFLRFLGEVLDLGCEGSADPIREATHDMIARALADRYGTWEGVADETEDRLTDDPTLPARVFAGAVEALTLDVLESLWAGRRP